MRASISIVCLLAMLAAGCGGDGDSAADADPQTLVLRASDLPQGFVVDSALTGPVENAEVAAGRPEGYEEKLDEWGRVGGYSRQLVRRGERGTGVRGADAITSVASVYEDEDGAADSFRTGVRDYAQAGYAPQGELGIGDEGSIFRGTATVEGRRVEYTVATWRTAPVIASIVIEARPERVDIATLKALARTQDQRVRAAVTE